MKQIALASLLILIAAGASAGTIIDLQTGVYAEGDDVLVAGAVVTGVLTEGFYINEDPNAPYAGVWVYTGGGHSVAVGDWVECKGAYEEFFGRTQINVQADATGYVTNLGAHTGEITPLFVSIHQLNVDAEMYEGSYVSIIDPMQVVSSPDGNGNWVVESQMPGGGLLTLDDAWYDAGSVMLEDCYCCATGIFSYGSGAFKLKPFADAICVIDCSVDTEEMGVSEVKNLFR